MSSHPPPPSPGPCNPPSASVSMDCSVLDISCQWDHTLCGLLGLASLAQHDALRLIPEALFTALQTGRESHSWLR